MNNKEIHKLLTDNGFTLDDRYEFDGLKYFDNFENTNVTAEYAATYTFIIPKTENHVSIRVYQALSAVLTWPASGADFDDDESGGGYEQTTNEAALFFEKLALAITLCNRINRGDKNDT